MAVSKKQIHKIIDRMTDQSLPTIKSFLTHLENHYLLKHYSVPTLKEVAMGIAITQKHLKKMYLEDDEPPFALTWKSVK